ncbi:PTS sugar transporter subunit IIC [Jeotgalicoccus sp. ATCC 8456]|nr:PTS sugar transporter subunit IIC [Jeotgalicoccus sp. ATCC 8456]
MGAFAGAAIATYLVEALNTFVIGDIFGIPFFQDAGAVAGSLDGTIVVMLVALAMKVAPVNAAILAAGFGDMGLIPGLFSAYLVSFFVLWLQKVVPKGLDFIIVILVGLPAIRLLGLAITPLVDNSLLEIGAIIQTATETNPLVMGLMLGGIVTIVGISPLSSMALTALLGLTGIPMAVAALSAFASSPASAWLFYKLKIGDLKSIISVAIEPLSKADLVTANPLPMYVTNFVGGALSGVVIATSGMVNDAPGTAAPVPGLLVMFGYNPAGQVLMYAAICAVISFTVAVIGSYVFRNVKIYNSEALEED